MANLQVKGMDDALYAQLKETARSENRSISQEVLFLLRRYLTTKHTFQDTPTAAELLLELAGSWEDRRPAERIIHELRRARKKSRKLTKGF